MKVIIVSGFLGSGKTSFIEKLSEHLDDMVILENDYANANIDKELLGVTDKEILSLEEGCICCSRKKDFATKLMTIENTIDPEYLVIEPTGIGYLSKVIKNIRPIEHENIRLLSPITIVDYKNIDYSLENYGELFIDQIQNSGCILLSKIEKQTKENINQAIEKLRKYTDSKILNIHYKDFSKKDWDNLIEDYDYSKLKSKDIRALNLDSLTYKDVSFKDFNQLGTYLNAVADNRFGKLIRAKGLAKIDGKYVKIDLVNGDFKVEKYDKDHEINSLIFIGEGLEKNSFDILFASK